jgi:hypothetical protein
VQDTVINNRQHPTMVALPMLAGNDNYPGIRVLNATNGSVIQTNLGYPAQYASAAWDNVGNLYGAAWPNTFWQVWSPPGTNQATTLAVAQVVVSPTTFIITGISAIPSSPGCSAITITFTASGNLLPSWFTLLGSPTVNGAYTPVGGASITGSSGTYQFAVTSCSTMFYMIEAQVGVSPPIINITGIAAIPSGPGCSAITIPFTASSNLLPSAFTLLGSPTVNGAYAAVGGASITGGSGTYQAAVTNCSTMFYKIGAQ